MKKKKYMTKGDYDHYQLGGYFTVKQYIITEQDGKLCLLLRFKNEMNTRIDGVEFALKQFNSDGKMLRVVRIRYSDLRVNAGQLYCPTNGIVLNDDCADFVIQMKYIISEKTKYSFRNGTVTAHYDIRGYDKKKKASLKSKVSVKRKFEGASKGHRKIAFVCFILVIAALWAVIGFSNNDYRNGDSLSDTDSTQITTIQSRSSVC